MDETGCADFIDTRKQDVLAPADYPDPTIPIPADRSEKRATLVGGIAASGIGFKPLIIVPRKTMAAEVEMAGYGPDQCLIVHQENGFITIRKFEQWIKEVLVPYIEERRKATGYKGKAILLLDGCKCNDIDGVEQRLQDKKIRVLTLSPHTSDQLQALDLGIFAVFKQFYKKRFHLKTWLTIQIIGMCDGWQRATVPRNIVNAFAAAGLVPVRGDGCCSLRSSEENAINIRRFPEEGLPVPETPPPQPIDEFPPVGAEGRMRRRLG
jgi:hypothetical protein